MSGETDKKNWEKERRDRMREAFSTLEKLLPSYDPSNVLTRINILNESIEYIQDMQDRVDELLKPNSDIISEVITNCSDASTLDSNGFDDAEEDMLETSLKLSAIRSNTAILENSSIKSESILATEMMFESVNESNSKLTDSHYIENQKLLGLSNEADKTLSSTKATKDGNLLKNNSIESNKCAGATHGNKVPMTSKYCTSVLAPKISRPTVMKKSMKARKISNRPMGRQAVRKFKKISHRRKMKV